tara:strand:- start:52 stop:240 length:189 start_codon:yes stop_codon:yes gene_type:complete
MENNTIIADVKYQKDESGNQEQTVMATINGRRYGVPMVLDNVDWAEIKKRVDAGTLTIADAD